MGSPPYSLSLSLSPSPRLLADSSFVTVPPSLLACACLSEAVSFVAPTQHRKCVERLSRLTSVEQVRLCDTCRSRSRSRSRSRRNSSGSSLKTLYHVGGTVTTTYQLAKCAICIKLPSLLLWYETFTFSWHNNMFIEIQTELAFNGVSIFFSTEYCRMYYYNIKRMCVMSSNRRSNRRAVRRRSQPHPLTLLILKEQNSLIFQRHHDGSILGLCFLSISLLTLSPHLSPASPPNL